jgi:outer membrane protein
MKYVIPAVLALFFVAPVFAQNNRAFDITANVVWLDPTNEGSIEDLDDPADIEFDGNLGYGISANIFFGNHLSAEFAIAKVDADTNITRRRAVGATGGNLDIMPLTAVLQWHFAPNGLIDPYIGAGAAYVLFDDFDANGVSGVDSIDFKDDAGLAINAGVGIRLGNRFGIVGDVKYVPLESNAKAVVAGTNQTAEGKVDISPIIVSGGLSLRF